MAQSVTSRTVWCAIIAIVAFVSGVVLGAFLVNTPHEWRGGGGGNTVCVGEYRLEGNVKTGFHREPWTVCKP